MCAAGMLASGSGLPVEKATEVWASDEAIIAPVRPLVCDGSHQHDLLMGADTRASRLWPWELAARVASGVATVIRRDWRVLRYDAYVWNHADCEQAVLRIHLETQSVYPTRTDTARTITCPGCVAEDDSIAATHTQDPNHCRYPRCKACRANQPKEDTDIIKTY